MSGWLKLLDEPGNFINLRFARGIRTEAECMRILLVEDDRTVAGFVIKGLREEGHNVVHADCAGVATERLGNENYDVIILDRILPGSSDGLDLVMNLRGRQNNTPVLILSGLGEANNKVLGF